jgi:hypothetical protein
MLLFGKVSVCFLNISLFEKAQKAPFLEKALNKRQCL